MVTLMDSDSQLRLCTHVHIKTRADRAGATNAKHAPEFVGGATGMVWEGEFAQPFSENGGPSCQNRVVCVECCSMS